MAEKHERVKGKQNNVKYIISAIILIAIVAFVVLALSRGNTTTTHSANFGEFKNSDSLKCTASNIEYPGFDNQNALSVDYTVDAIFHDNKFYSMTFAYLGEYDNSDEAASAKTNIHVSLYEYIGHHEVSVSDLSSINITMPEDNKVKVAISADTNDVTENSAEIFMLDRYQQGDSYHIPNSIDEFKSNYTSKGFICKKVT